ncbi:MULTISPECIES: hypothetical protein [Emticicia]|uniref:hypothetical protein n=1 Tax=Emticicia TaxID=312278 RepID=UPI0007D8A737|nr:MULTISPECIES: hypothetical protein [Emticicia]
MQLENSYFLNRQTLFLVFFSLIYFSLSLPAGYAGFNIDASWHEALVMAIDKGFVFGRDFIFNYGPLGYLNTGLLPKSVSIWVLVAAEILTLVNYLIIIKLCFQKSPKNFWLVAIAALVIFMPWGFISDTSFTFFYFFIFWLLYAKQTHNSGALILAIVLSVLIFYIKVNLSIIVYGLFWLSLCYFWWAKAFTLRTLIFCLFCQILLTYVFSILLHVDVPAYLGASLKIIDAYQDAMATMLLSSKDLAVLLVFEGLIVLVVLLFALRTFSWLFKNHFFGLYLYVLIALAWFLGFKQAHTAVGAYNIFGFFLLMPPLATLIYLFSENQEKLWAGRMFVVVLCLQLVATQIIRYYVGEKTFKGYVLTYPPDAIANDIKEKGFEFDHILQIIAGKNPVNYLNRLVSYQYDDNFKDSPVVLPVDLKSKIGNASVDIVPHQISHIYFNQLNYNPRPVIQSYQANSDWLMKKNGGKYVSTTAPAIVLFRIDPFREQNPFWVETDLTESLLRNYQLTDTCVIQQDSFAVFQKNKVLKKITSSKISTIKAKLNEEIPIPQSSSPIRFSADIQYSVKGKLSRLLFQPPYLYCSVTYENGKQENFRVIDKILKGGVFINQKVITHAELSNFFVNKGVDNQRVTKIRFWSNQASGFEQSFDGQFNEIKIME